MIIAIVLLTFLIHGINGVNHFGNDYLLKIINNLFYSNTGVRDTNRPTVYNRYDKCKERSII